MNLYIKNTLLICMAGLIQISAKSAIDDNALVKEVALASLELIESFDLTASEREQSGWLIDYYERIVLEEGDLMAIKDSSRKTAFIQTAMLRGLNREMDSGSLSDEYYEAIRVNCTPLIWKYKLVFEQDSTVAVILLGDYFKSLSKLNAPLGEIERQLANEFFDWAISQHAGLDKSDLLYLISAYLDFHVGKFSPQSKVVLRKMILENPMLFEDSIISFFDALREENVQNSLSLFSNHEIERLLAGSSDSKDILNPAFFSKILEERDWDGYPNAQVFLMRHLLNAEATRLDESPPEAK